jgi:hypothetical protein
MAPCELTELVACGVVEDEVLSLEARALGLLHPHVDGLAVAADEGGRAWC